MLVRLNFKKVYLKYVLACCSEKGKPNLISDVENFKLNL